MFLLRFCLFSKATVKEFKSKFDFADGLPEVDRDCCIEKGIDAWSVSIGSASSFPEL